MRKFNLDNLETDSVRLVRDNRFKVLVELYVTADCADDACELVKELIEETKIDRIDRDGDEVINDYDIVDCEPAEAI